MLVGQQLGAGEDGAEAGELEVLGRSRGEPVEVGETLSLADLLLTPSADADENLRKEGLPERKIKLVGNIMIDALVTNLAQSRASQLPAKLGLKEKEFVYVTLHRPSNVDERPALTAIIDELKSLAQRLPVVFPMHPRTLKMCAEFGIRLDGVMGLQVLEPVGYHDSLCLTERARCHQYLGQTALAQEDYRALLALPGISENLRAEAQDALKQGP